jgi:hypothetical protein
MQAQVFGRILARIDDELQLAALIEMSTFLLEPGTRTFTESKATFTDLLWTVRERFAALATESQVADIMMRMGLADQFATANMTELLTTIQNNNDALQLQNQPHMYALVERLRSATNAAHRLRLAFDHLVTEPRQDTVGVDEYVIELRVYDLDKEGPSPSQLSEILQVVADLYAAVLELYPDASAAFRVAYLDSGSDLLLAFKGAVHIIQELKRLLEEWRRLQELGLDTMARESGLIDQWLTMLSKVKAMEESHTLDAGRARHIKARVLQRLDALTLYGVAIEDGRVSEIETHRVALLKRRERGQLTDGGHDAQRSTGEPS